MQRRNTFHQSPSKNISTPPMHPLPLQNHRNHLLFRSNSFQGKNNPFKQTSLKKSFLVNDDDYNSMIYEWRRNATAPIVKVFTLSQEKQIDGRSGKIFITNVVKIEHIKHRLTQISKVSIGQSLYILTNMLDGHQAIFKKLGATSISLDKCGLNEEGQLKVWINHWFDRNDMSGEILNAQDRIVEKIFQIIDLLTDKKLQNFKYYVAHNIQLNNWSFTLMKNMIKSYSQSLRIQIPNKIILINPTYQPSVLKFLPYTPRPYSVFDIKHYSSPSEKPASSFTTFTSNKHKKNTSSHFFEELKSQSTKYTDSMIDVKTSKALNSQTKQNIRLPSLHFIANNSLTFQNAITSLVEAPKSQGENCKKITTRLFKENQLSLSIHQQYNYAFHTKRQPTCLKKEEKQSFASTENQTNKDSLFIKLRGSSIEKQTNLVSKRSQYISRPPNYEHKFNATFGKSMEGRPLFDELQEEIESFENSSEDQKPTKVDQKEKIEGKKIFQLLLNRQLAFSTYLQSSSEKKQDGNSSGSSSNKEKRSKLQEFMLMAKQKQILEINCWTKKLEGLFNLSEDKLKQSISFDSEQTQNLFRQIKLSKLGKWGREVQKSLIPQ